MLSIRQLSKTYSNGTRALHEVDLEIGQGIFGLLGPNGAGKSTLMRTIAALQKPDRGRILFEGVDIVKYPQAIREQLGYLPQEFGVYPRISAFDLLDHLAVLKGLSHRAERREQVLALLAQTNLFEVRNQAVSSFSGGMRQRFGIAQALLGAPRLIIVDEPTAGLDPEERNRFHNLLAELGDRAVVLLSTHIVEDVRDLCPRMAVLAGGEVKLQGEPSALIESLRQQIWRKSLVPGELAALASQHVVLSQRLVAGRSVVHVWADAPPPGFEAAPVGLEEVYFAVLRRGATPCS